MTNLSYLIGAQFNRQDINTFESFGRWEVVGTIHDDNDTCLLTILRKGDLESAPEPISIRDLLNMDADQCVKGYCWDEMRRAQQEKNLYVAGVYRWLHQDLEKLSLTLSGWVEVK